MKCEQFLFEASYICDTSGEDMPQEALDHLRECISCRAQFHRLGNGFSSIESESSAQMSGRLHHAIDLMIAEKPARLERRASFGRMWLPAALALLILVGSIAGIAYQNHPTQTMPMYARR
ncbi:MAG TPA: hypothetical protein VKY85_28700 [Candidatus Angelobacter sp.]|nr:hypothetical protein [Candidatus Angelobacter sp.]